MPNAKILKTIYFVRHGQADCNVDPVFASAESPLSEEGRKQAAYIAERVSKLSFQAIISSTFQRAKETADTIATATGKTAEYSELFVERIKPSYIDGKPHTDEKASKLWEEWQVSLFKSDMRVEDGENYDDLVSRADKALKWLSERTEESLVVVTHGFFLKTIIARILLGQFLSGDTYLNFQKSSAMENTGLTVLHYRQRPGEEPHWRLWIYNDHAHLG
jgi:broad specificity phosphatase PhoE